ncbi:MAG: heavy metal-binding domain-containing protein [Bryobacter sp.]|nr:heavy metal-binding domain-containing protein [Bryobacter sp.]
MLLTTTSNLEGKRITQYLGIVSGEAILGTNLFKDMFAGVRDLIGGRSGTYEKELRNAKTIATQEMIEEANRIGANAIIGVDIDYEEISPGQGTMLMVAISGTAIRYED